MGPTHSFSLYGTFPTVASWLHKVAGAGRNRTEQNGMEPTRAAAAVGPAQAATTTREGLGRGGSNGYACYCVLSLFLYVHLFFISLFFFSNYFLTDKYNNRRGTKGKCRTDRTGHARAAIATWDNTEGTDGANGYVFFYVSVFSILLFYSYHSSSFAIISFSVEYNNRRAGQDRPIRAAMATPDGTGGHTGTSGTYIFCYSFLFLLFSFPVLATGRGQVE